MCGVRSGEKLCLYPLNCKYHAVSVKRLVPGRTRPFDELLAEFNAAQLAARKQEKVIRARRPSAANSAAAPNYRSLAGSVGGLSGGSLESTVGGGPGGEDDDGEDAGGRLHVGGGGRLLGRGRINMAL